MKLKHAFHYLIALGAALLLIGCNSPVKPEPTATLATPRPYELIPTEKLGVNENGKGLESGTVVTSVELNDISGHSYDLATAWKSRPALVVFYRGGWCPYCNMQVRELSEDYDQLSAAGVQPVLISVDAPDKTALLTATYDLPFPVLSDPDLEAHTMFNVLLTLDDQTLEKYREYGIDLSEWSGRDHHTIAVASVFLIDQQGRVLVSQATTDYRQRPNTEQLLQLIEQNLHQHRQTVI